MIHYLPDPHPGRCQNHRVDVGDPYRVKTLRCLKLEGHPEACRFPPKSKPPESGKCNSIVAPNPKPWIEPQEAE